MNLEQISQIRVLDAATRRYPVKKVLWKISQISQENTGIKVFWKYAANLQENTHAEYPAAEHPVASENINVYNMRDLSS